MQTMFLNDTLNKILIIKYGNNENPNKTIHLKVT